MATTLEKTDAKRRPFFRKAVVLPAEHGSWSWLLVPLLVGTAVGGAWNTAVTLTLVGGLGAFLMRQPLTVWLRARRGRARRSDGPLALSWAAAFGLLAALSMAGLLALGLTELLWLLPPVAVILVFYLLAANRGRANVRALWMELAGAAGLAATAPAGYVAATGRLSPTAWWLWALLAGQNVLGMLYVRLRIADTHGRSNGRWSLVWAHAAVMTTVGLAAAFNFIPWLAVAPFVGFLARAVWTAVAPRPIANVKRFGFAEVGVELLGGLLLIVGGW